MNKKRTLVGAIVAIVVVLVAGGYTARSMHYQTRFLPKTTLLGVDIGGDTVKSAEVKLQDQVKAKKVQLTDHGNTAAVATASQLGLSHHYTSTLNKLLADQNPWGFTAHVQASDGTKQAQTAVDATKFDAYVKKTTTSLNKNRKAPVNASVVAQGSSFVVKKEENGNQIDPAKLKTALSNALSEDKQTVELASTYKQPTIKASDSRLKTAAKTLANMTNLNGQVKIANHTVTIPKHLLRSWLSYTNDQVTVSQSGVAAYVASLAKQYNTFGKTRSFKTHNSGTVSVPGGTYGWSIVQASTTADLIKSIKTGKDFTLTAKHQGAGYHEDGTDIGNTYVEVDLTNQHEYYYKDGKLTLDSKIVSGKPGQATPKGVDYVWSKQRNATLRGTNDDGSSYASPVSYWMPIDYTGVGLHDSPWQPRYGGDWYKQHGSHGCVNNPPSFMAKLYAAVDVGTPVIIY